MDGKGFCTVPIDDVRMNGVMNDIVSSDGEYQAIIAIFSYTLCHNSILS